MGPAAWLVLPELQAALAQKAVSLQIFGTKVDGGFAGGRHEGCMVTTDREKLPSIVDGQHQVSVKYFSRGRQESLLIPVEYLKPIAPSAGKFAVVTGGPRVGQLVKVMREPAGPWPVMPLPSGPIFTELSSNLAHVK